MPDASAEPMWLKMAKGVAAAAFAGGASAAVDAVRASVAPGPVDWGHLTSVFVAGALAGVFLYFKTPPKSA